MWKNANLHVRLLVHLHFDVLGIPPSTGCRSIVFDRDGLQLRRTEHSHIYSSDSVAIGSYFSDVDVVEMEHILGLSLEWCLSTFGLLQRMLDDLVLVAVERDEHFRFGVGTVDRVGLRGDRVVDF